jgi:hypothetical protein
MVTGKDMEAAVAYLNAVSQNMPKETENIEKPDLGYPVR